MTDSITPEQRCRRVLYRASHRGTKEMDWLLGRYAAAALPAMNGEELALFEEMLALSDPEIEGWIRCDEPPLAFRKIIADIRAFHGLGS